VKAFFDTSVLVAVFYGDHQHHQASLEAFLAFNKQQAGCGAHSLAEVYATLTRMPGKHRISGEQAMLFLGTMRERLTLVSLTSEEYFAGIEKLAGFRVMGGAIYDGLLALCALKARAESIYTWNLKHYQQLGIDVAQRLQTP
jgi:predicted nucleic acid-binding protein